MTNKEFLEQLSLCKEERKVEDVYNQIVETYFQNINIQYPNKCDGYFESKYGDIDYSVIMEFKYDLDFKNKTDKCKVICQTVAYLKKFDESGKKLPDVILIGDINECFVLPVSVLVKHIDIQGIDWNIAPSSFFNNTALLTALENDDEIVPWVFDIDEKFDFKNVYDLIVGYITNKPKVIDINEHNVDGIFRDFEKRVIKDKKLNSNEKVSAFMGIITHNEDNYYKHPKKKDTLVIKSDTETNKNIRIDSSQYDSFVKQFNTNITFAQKRRLTSICDRLLADESRRLKGEFYTPTPFVDYAHLMISNILGENWKSEYVVWDPAWGCGNLTRDYVFNELYASTLEQADLNTAESYNSNSVKFQYDFLNDGLEKLPSGLIEAFKQNKKILFFLNPPYGTAVNLSREIVNKTGIAKTKINTEMTNLKLGHSSANLYAQFLYRICKIKRHFNLSNCYMALFCKPNFMTSGSYKKFRKLFLNHFEYKDGFIFNAGHFGNVSSAWGITFNVWKSIINLEEI